MLKTRVITAVVLLAVLLPVLFQPSPWPFAWVTVALMGAAGWEWARLNGLPGIGAIAAGTALALACVWTLLIGGSLAWTGLALALFLQAKAGQPLFPFG